MRKYVDSDLSFLEVKHKNNKGRTIKHRKVIRDIRQELNNEDENYIQDISGLTGMLESKLTNHFQRVTLVHKTAPERLTFDLGLSFIKEDEEVILDTLVIAELKQEAMDRNSTFAKLVKKRLIRPERISKYCIGVAMLEKDIKKNRIKRKLQLIHKMT